MVKANLDNCYDLILRLHNELRLSTPAQTCYQSLVPPPGHRLGYPTSRSEIFSDLVIRLFTLLASSSDGPQRLFGPGKGEN